MELLVHASTSGHLLVGCSLEVVAIQIINVHVIMATPNLLLWACNESVTQRSWASVFYPNATLWDGQVCGWWYMLPAQQSTMVHQEPSQFYHRGY